MYAAAKTEAGLRAVKFTQQFWNMRAMDMLEEPNVMSFRRRLHNVYCAQLNTAVTKYVAEVAQGRQPADFSSPDFSKDFPPMALHAEDHKLLLQRMSPADGKGSSLMCSFFFLLCPCMLCF